MTPTCVHTAGSPGSAPAVASYAATAAGKSACSSASAPRRNDSYGKTPMKRPSIVWPSTTLATAPFPAHPERRSAATPDTAHARRVHVRSRRMTRSSTTVRRSLPRAGAATKGRKRLAMQVRGQGVVISGGASGLGRATALKFAQAGAKVAVLDRNEALAQEVAKEISGVAIPCDVSSGPEVGRGRVREGRRRARERARGRERAQASDGRDGLSARRGPTRSRRSRRPSRSTSSGRSTCSASRART